MVRCVFKNTVIILAVGIGWIGEAHASVFARICSAIAETRAAREHTPAIAPFVSRNRVARIPEEFLNRFNAGAMSTAENMDNVVWGITEHAQLRNFNTIFGHQGSNAISFREQTLILEALQGEKIGGRRVLEFLVAGQ